MLGTMLLLLYSGWQRVTGWPRSQGRGASGMRSPDEVSTSRLWSLRNEYQYARIASAIDGQGGNHGPNEEGFHFLYARGELDSRYRTIIRIQASCTAAVYQ